MILVMDIGNSQSVFALFGDEGVISSHWRSATERHLAEDDLLLSFNLHMKARGFAANVVTGIALASVVPVMTKKWLSLCVRLFEITPLVIDARLQFLPALEIENPHELGGDRIANAAAAAAHYSLPAIVIDFGTATTFDIISGEGAHRGGIIAPGLHRSLEALVAAAARLSDVPLEMPPTIIGKNTSHAMQSGLLWGTLAMIEGMIVRINQETQEQHYVIATGGLGGLFCEQSALIDVYHEHLTLEGIHTLYRLNDKSLL